MPAAIVDLVIGKDMTPVTNYIALSRLKRREDVLIYREFPAETMRKGPPEGPTLLLRVLRGEPVDWDALTQQRMPKKRCVHCHELRFKDEYTPAEWEKKTEPCCKKCRKDRQPTECQATRRKRDP